ncbi:MAG: octaprenyl diphosphate synthase [Gammaproteobacteria bacterium]|nr:octaprenyl diphosphate synthase [Gammaproteobacteria bacterium]MCP5138177.1 octaprenyl diphosphate synthase [Gammaproteobacteria bacterium]
MQLDVIRDLVADDLRAVDTLIQDRLRSDVALVNQLGAYIVNSGGKRLRPLLVVLAARACGYRGDRHVDLAAIVEFIHTATLLHDDVVDASDLRRGRDTANALWGNEASVLVGDFLYSRAFQMMTALHELRIMEILAVTTNVIAEGEVLQLMNCHDPDVDEAGYMAVIRYKTAKLFEAGTRLGAVINQDDAAIESAMAAYGMHLGTAFQIIDDVLDYSSDSDEMGKNVGDDLAEGKPTLPLIYVMRHGDPTQAAVVRKAIEEGGRDKIDAVIKAIESTDAIPYTTRLARQEADLAKAALAQLPASPYREALLALADFAVERSH